MTNQLLNYCKRLLPEVEFTAGTTFYWSPRGKKIYLNRQALSENAGGWALLHEVAHAQLNHTSYKSDVELLKLEVAAWEQALETAQKVAIQIDADHIQDCLDTYREWLYARSTCPTCSLNSLQTDERTYICVSCNTTWLVSRSRFCRPYRMKQAHENI